MANFNFPFIPENHRTALARYIETNKSVLLEHSIAQLYRCCLDCHQSDDKKVRSYTQEQDVIYSKFAVGEMQVATCTFKTSGIFVQLAGKITDKELQLTAGQKWISEGRDREGNLCTIFFSKS